MNEIWLALALVLLLALWLAFSMVAVILTLAGAV